MVKNRLVIIAFFLFSKITHCTITHCVGIKNEIATFSFILVNVQLEQKHYARQFQLNWDSNPCPPDHEQYISCPCDACITQALN